MRGTLDQQLDFLHTQMIEMGAMCEGAISGAAKAIIEGEASAAEEAVRIDSLIDEKEREIEAHCLKLMLRQQPVARDLRQISSALKMITDMERIGDQARDIAEISRYTSLRHLEGTLSLDEMAKAVIHMVTGSVDAFVRHDLQLARSVIAHDDVVDNCFDLIKQELIKLIRNDVRQSEAAMDLLMVSKYLERIGDHATNIAEWVEFSITGVHGGKKT